MKLSTISNSQRQKPPTHPSWVTGKGTLTHASLEGKSCLEHATAWKGLEDIVLSETSQSQGRWYLT